MRILLIEDDSMIARAMQKGLVRAGFCVDWVADARAAELAVAGAAHDLAILDLGLPGQDGLAFLVALRRAGNPLPVLIASARDTVADRAAGLAAGADDYVLKPFDLDELVAHVRAVLRRHAGEASPVLQVGRLVLDPRSRSVTRDGVPVALAPAEFAVLEVLMRRPGAVVSREEIEASLRGHDDEAAGNAVEALLQLIRRKLGPSVIRSVRGVGYRISED